MSITSVALAGIVLLAQAGDVLLLVVPSPTKSNDSGVRDPVEQVLEVRLRFRLGLRLDDRLDRGRLGSRAPEQDDQGPEEDQVSHACRFLHPQRNAAARVRIVVTTPTRSRK